MNKFQQQKDFEGKASNKAELDDVVGGASKIAAETTPNESTDNPDDIKVTDEVIARVCGLD